MQVVARIRFVHGTHDLQRGDSADMPEATAHDLERAGLVRIEKKAPTPDNKMAKEPSNKAKK